MVEKGVMEDCFYCILMKSLYYPNRLLNINLEDHNRLINDYSKSKAYLPISFDKSYFSVEKLIVSTDIIEMFLN